MELQYDAYLGAQSIRPNLDLPVLNKYTQEQCCRVPLADAAMLNEAIGLADRARKPMARLKAYERRDILLHAVSRFKEMRDQLAEALCIEAGKPIKDSRGEVTRLIETFQIAAEECTRLTGEMIPMDISARTANYQGMTKRVPIGPVSCISPFNFPLNLAAHKIAPAIATGCPFILKPASLTPVGALMMGQVLAETALPEGSFSILPCRRDAADALVEDDRLKLLSFTGSPEVGWNLKARSRKKKVVLELGGNAAAIVEADADIEKTVPRLLIGAFYQSGQVCISLQRLFIHRSIYQEVKQALVNAAAALPMGDPQREDTWIGPMISLKEAERLRAWMKQAMDAGAQCLCGGLGEGIMIPATVMESVPSDQVLSCEEAFGPVVILEAYDDFEEAIAKVNDSRFGLQAGVFTNDLRKMYQAWDELEVGGVCINDVPAFRVDHMPYGGVKDSGLGREGLRYAMEDMTEIRMLAIRGQ